MLTSPWLLAAPIPLSASALEIHRRLTAGESVERVTEIGRWRGGWTRADVLLVQAAWQQLAAENDAERARVEKERVSESPKRRAECGTTGGAQKHRRNHERLCEPCRLARNEYQNTRRRKTAGDAA